jgi:hypothetical protein
LDGVLWDAGSTEGERAGIESLAKCGVSVPFFAFETNGKPLFSHPAQNASRTRRFIWAGCRHYALGLDKRTRSFADGGQ